MLPEKVTDDSDTTRGAGAVSEGPRAAPVADASALPPALS